MDLSVANRVKIPVVYYHSVGPVNNLWSRNFLTLELRFLEDQFKYYSKNFTSISLKKYWEIRNGFSNPVKNPLVITFDDGYLDNWIWAFPLLKKYRLHATIFVSPEFVDLKNGIRPNLEDYEKGNASKEEIFRWGFLSWDEMKYMEDSGYVDIQSHTATHTKYYVSEKIIEFHHPKDDCLYPVGNMYPEMKPYYIGNEEFERKLPYGYPFFEEASSVIAHKVEINPDFITEVIQKTHKASGFFGSASTVADLSKIYEDFRRRERLILSIEDEDQYNIRLNYEIVDSKTIIEKKLNKKVEFLCWPHGDFTDLAHEIAIRAGYLATTVGSHTNTPDSPDRIPERIGIYHSKNNRTLSILKAKLRINNYLGRFPAKAISSFYKSLKYGKPNN
jgi:hypothetical protein